MNVQTQGYNVKIKLIDHLQPCHCGHQIGDEWTFDYMTIPGMCSLAWNAIYPVVLAFRFGATFPWQEKPDTIIMSCPDAEVNNVFEISRTPLP